jgi:hypothetical protein
MSDTAFSPFLLPSLNHHDPQQACPIAPGSPQTPRIPGHCSGHPWASAFFAVLHPDLTSARGLVMARNADGVSRRFTEGNGSSFLPQRTILRRVRAGTMGRMPESPDVPRPDRYRKLLSGVRDRPTPGSGTKWHFRHRPQPPRSQSLLARKQNWFYGAVALLMFLVTVGSSMAPGLKAARANASTLLRSQ